MQGFWWGNLMEKDRLKYPGIGLIIIIFIYCNWLLLNLSLEGYMRSMQ